MIFTATTKKLKEKENNNQHAEGRNQHADFVFPASTGESNVMQINNTMAGGSFKWSKNPMLIWPSLSILYHKYGHI